MSEFMATVIAAMHVVVIAIDITGAVAVYSSHFRVTRLMRWQQVYLGIVFGKSVSLVCLGSCPLTTAENFFRRQGNFGTAFNDSFVSHYLPELPAEIDLLMTFLLMLAGLIAVVRVAVHNSLGHR